MINSCSFLTLGRLIRRSLRLHQVEDILSRRNYFELSHFVTFVGCQEI